MKLRDFSFCDEVRFERSNKISVMGLYGDLINLQSKDPSDLKFPIFIRLATLLRFDFDKDEVKPDSFKLILKMNGNVVAEVTGSMAILTNRTQGNIAVNGEGVPIELGDIGFVVSLFNGGQELYSKEVKSAIRVTLNEL
jgi:hypothetical protein